MRKHEKTARDPLGGRRALFAAAIVASLVVAGGGFGVTWRNWTEVQRATEHLMEVNDASSELRTIFGEIVANAGPLMMTGDRTLLTRAENDSRRFDAALDRLGQTVAGYPESQALFDVLSESRAATRPYETRYFDLLRSGDLAAAVEYVQTSEFMEAGMAFGPAFESLLATANDDARSSYASAQAAEQVALMGWAAGFFVVVALWTAIAFDWFRQTRAAQSLNDDLERQVEARTRRLNAALARANAASEAKSAFLATMSHELRTPLNGVLGMASVMAGTGLDASQKTMLDAIEGSGRKLLGLLSNILEYARHEGGDAAATLAPFNLDALLERSLAPRAAEAEKKSLAFDVTIEDVARGDYLGDEERIERLLDILLSNAVKFTDDGGIAVRASAAGACLKVTVSDTGPGIPQSRLGMIFDSFTQIDGSIKRRHDGAGIGLALARALASHMGGDVGVESEEGRGSTFWFALPLERAPAHAAPEAEAA